jgi:hypothetical protein
LQNFIDASIVAPVRNLMNLSTSVMNQVLGVVDPIKGIISSESSQLIGIASDLAQVGRNVFWAYNSIATLPDTLMHQVSAVANAFENAMCVLKNAFTPEIQYQDYSDLYGASICSSTIGGSPPSPLAGTNPFESIVTLPSTVVAVTPQAQINIAAMKVSDFIASPATLTSLGSTVTAIANGVTVQ